MVPAHSLATEGVTDPHYLDPVTPHFPGRLSSRSNKLPNEGRKSRAAL